ncbi:hypothetical protein [Oscillatoria salina]|uniref:hypothetical protein n=1 Tax=Oscillatoria salina TaxID=331517 RepID=UPI001CCD268A|nr:hypothetical protein [Oscillatoria salina]
MFNFKLSNLSGSFAGVSLATVLGLTGVSWIGIEAIAPQVAQAYTARLDVELNRQEGETYQTMLRRAEAVARAAAQRAFDSDILVNDVAVTILGENEGAIAPILRLDVSRQSWRRQPDPQVWATYFPNVESLLDFESVAVNEENEAVDGDVSETEATDTENNQPGLPNSPLQPELFDPPNATTGDNPTSPELRDRPTTTTGNSDSTPEGFTNQPNTTDSVNPNPPTLRDVPTTTTNNP